MQMFLIFRILIYFVLILPVIIIGVILSLLARLCLKYVDFCTKILGLNFRKE